jgi:hypothetical protein
MAERRITSGVGTVPNYTAVASTTVTSQTDTTVLLSSGTTNLADIFFDGGVGLDGVYYAYVPGVSGTGAKIAKIIGIYQISLTAGTYVFSIQLDSAMPDASADALYYIKAGVAWKITNDGGSGTAAAGSIGDGSTAGQVLVKANGVVEYKPYEKYSNRQKLQPVKYIDASSTSFFIEEEL